VRLTSPPWTHRVNPVLHPGMPLRDGHEWRRRTALVRSRLQSPPYRRASARLVVATDRGEAVWVRDRSPRAFSGMPPHASGPDGPVGNPRRAPLKHAVGASYQCRDLTVTGRTPRRADLWEPRCGTSTFCSARGPCGACPSLSRRRECCPVCSRARGRVDPGDEDRRKDGRCQGVSRRPRRSVGGPRPTAGAAAISSGGRGDRPVGRQVEARAPLTSPSPSQWGGPP
jgi:hypothetical protein